MHRYTIRPSKLLVIVAIASCFTCRATKHSDLREDLAANASNIQLDEETHPEWVLSGFLHEAPKQKVYITIAKGRIAALNVKPPSGKPLLETDAYIFPGLIDMHNHMQYNVLPLWDNARGQYINRFEWRGRSLPYKKAVSGNMGAFKGDTLCGAVRWAEIKALTGGATAIQGVGGHVECAGRFALRNLEEPRVFGDNKSIRSYVDIVNPSPIGKIYDTAIKPLMIAENLSYEAAYKQWLTKIGVQAWLEDFQDKFKNSPTFVNGARLILNAPMSDRNFELLSDTPAVGALQTESRRTKAMVRAALESLQLRPAHTEQASPESAMPFAQALSAAPYWIKPEAYETQVSKMVDWIYDFMKGAAPEESMPLWKQAQGFLTPDANLAFHRDVRKFITDFNSFVWSPIQSGFQNNYYHAVVAHLAEGRRDDAYNQSEYPMAEGLGLARPGMVFIHGVGLTDFVKAREQGVSLVWSPFSNLLLYGQTLDIKAALEAGVNIALGPDWTPTGSKHMLDELKIARRYLDHAGITVQRNGMTTPITNKMLFEMATINAARAMRVEDRLGKVRPGYLADLLLIHRTDLADPYRSLVEATQKEVALVVAAGRPVYGDQSLIETIAAAYQDNVPVQKLPLASQADQVASGCQGYAKALRLPYANNWDNERPSNSLQYRTVVDLHKVLDQSLKTYAQSWREKAVGPRAWEAAHIVDTVDPLFNCEDTDYSARFATFVEQEVAANLVRRDEIRAAEFSQQSGNNGGNTSDAESGQ